MLSAALNSDYSLTRALNLSRNIDDSNDLQF